MKIFSSFALVALAALAVPRALAVPEDGGVELPPAVHKKSLKEIVYEKSHAVGKPKFPRGTRSRGLKQRGASSADVAHRVLGKSGGKGGGKGGFDSCCEVLETLSKIDAKCYDVLREFSVYETSEEFLDCAEDLKIGKGSEDPAVYLDLEEKYFKYQEEFFDVLESLLGSDDPNIFSENLVSENLVCLSQISSSVDSDTDAAFALGLWCVDEPVDEPCDCECYCGENCVFEIDEFFGATFCDDFCLCLRGLKR